MKRLAPMFSEKIGLRQAVLGDAGVMTCVLLALVVVSYGLLIEWSFTVMVSLSGLFGVSVWRVMRDSSASQVPAAAPETDVFGCQMRRLRQFAAGKDPVAVYASKMETLYKEAFVHLQQTDKLLGRRLNPGELTYQRYMGAAQAAFKQAGELVERVLETLECAQVGTGMDESEYSSRNLECSLERLGSIRHSLCSLNHAILEMGHTEVKATAVQAVIRELDELAERAPKY